MINNFDEYSKVEIQQMVNSINVVAEKTYNLLLNLLEWSRSQRNSMYFKPEKANLFLLVQDVYLLSKEAADDKNIKIRTEIPQDLSLDVDQEMIKTVIRNLVSNALKFTPENGNISILTKPSHKNVEIHIKDSGIGMSEQTIKSLFKIEETQSQEGTNGEQGTGFGLLLCKEFIDKHNGKIIVESEIGKGSNFILTLPLQQKKLKIENVQKVKV